MRKNGRKKSGGRIKAGIALGLAVCMFGGCSAKERADDASGQAGGSGLEATEGGETDVAKGGGTDPAGEHEADTEKEAESVAYVQPEMKGTITVSVYQSSEWLETAVYLFEEHYPEMTVELHPFFTGEDSTIPVDGGAEIMSDRPAGQTREDYLARLNTRLLSGETEDIVITSEGLPLDSYIHAGVFTDLAPFLGASSADINEDNYYMNVFDAYRTKEGELYQLPLAALSCPTVVFDGELALATGLGPEDTEALTWREALDIGERMYNASELPNTFMPQAWALMGDCITKLVMASVDYENSEIHLDEERLGAYLDVFEELETYQAVPMGFDFYNNEFHRAVNIEYGDDVQLALLAVRGDSVCVPLKWDDGKVCLTPYYALDFGISGQSGNKELAWEFLKFLLSDEVQTLPSFPRAGVNKNGLAARVEGYMSTVDCTPEEKGQVLDLVDSWVSRIDGYTAEDTDLIQISEGAYYDFVRGDSTREEMIATLKAHLEQYISQ